MDRLGKMGRWWGVLAVFAGAVLASAPSVWAAKEAIIVVGPRSQLEGLAVDAKVLDDGLVRYRITRDPKAARFTGRSCHLTIGDGDAPLAQVRVEGQPLTNGRLRYEVRLRRDQIKDAELILCEDQSNGEKADEVQLLGGGQHFRIHLEAFEPR